RLEQGTDAPAGREGRRVGAGRGGRRPRVPGLRRRRAGGVLGPGREGERDLAGAREGRRPATGRDRHDRRLDGSARVPDAKRRRHGAGPGGREAPEPRPAGGRRDRAGARRLARRVPGAGERHHGPRRRPRPHLRGVRVGAHLRSGLRTAVPLARETGAEVVQLFISNPRAWSGPRLETAQAFGAEWREAAIGPLFVHAPYLVNIASPNPEFLSKSIELCRRSVAACGVLEAGGFVVHSGAGGEGEVADALDRCATVLQAVLLETPDETQLLVELMSGTSGAVASTLAEARTLFDAVDDARLGLVLDTCHLFATGYALDEPEGVDALFGELRELGLADRLRLIHMNDAKFERGSKRDRHEIVGEGGIGLEGFRAIVNQPEVRDLSVVVETPSSGERRRLELETIRSLAA